MPKGVALTVDKFVSQTVAYLNKKSADAREIILDHIRKGAQAPAPKAGKKPGPKGKAKIEAAAATAPAKPTKTKAAKGKKLKGQTTAEAIAETPAEDPGE